MSCDLVGVLRLGHKVDRSAAALPQTATDDLFEVQGGRVQILGLLGEVTTAGGGQVDLRLDYARTSPSLTQQWGSLAAAPVDTLGLYLTVTDSGFSTNGARGNLSPLGILDDGVIQLVTGGNQTGQMSWTLFYVPVDAGATVTAV